MVLLMIQEKKSFDEGLVELVELVDMYVMPKFENVIYKYSH